LIVSLKDSGTSYTEVTSLAAVTASKFYNDRDNKIIYLRASDSSNPNSRYLVMTQKLFFSNNPVSAPYDLSSGFEVYWHPSISNVSEFKTELDNQNQLGLAIEGSGSLSLFNDMSFWPDNYDTMFFENHKCMIYSWNRELPITQAKLLFRGRIQGKKYSTKNINFSLKDFLNELRGEIPVVDLGDVGDPDFRLSDDLMKAKARIVFGEVYGMQLTPVDKILDGYPISGTISVTNASASITGSLTSFLSELKPDDVLIISGVEYTVGNVTTNTALTLSEPYGEVSDSGLSVTVKPNIPKNFANRIFKIAGHELREPNMTITEVLSLTRIRFDDTRDVRSGDVIFFVPTQERATVEMVAGDIVVLTQTLNTTPVTSDSVLRPPTQNVRINNTFLFYDRDYTVDAATAKLTLDQSAEFNTAPVREGDGTAIFNSTSTVTGSGTSYTTQLRPGDYIKANGQATFYEILTIDSDTQLRLTQTAGYTTSTTFVYKPVDNFDPDKDVLTADVYGATETPTGATDGVFIKTASQIVKDLLRRAGLSSFLNTSSFDDSSELAPFTLGLVIPEKFNSQSQTKYRDTINKINKSIFGSLVQNEDFELEYNVLSPKRPVGISVFREFDILDFVVEQSSDKMAKIIIVQYLNKEIDPELLAENFSIKEVTSNIGQYILQTDRITTIESLLVVEDDARILATRWKLITEIGSSVIKFKTKMQAARLQVNDKIEFNHEKLYQRTGGGRRKISAIQSISKSGFQVDVEVEDLSNTFNRCGTITGAGVNNFDNSTEDERLYYGYITDTFGLINNDPETFGLNLIW
jgi:hypothetical protein